LVNLKFNDSDANFLLTVRYELLKNYSLKVFHVNLKTSRKFFDRSIKIIIYGYSNLLLVNLKFNDSDANFLVAHNVPLFTIYCMYRVFTMNKVLLQLYIHISSVYISFWEMRYTFKLTFLSISTKNIKKC